MTKPIYDWRDGSKYPSDPSTGAPAAFIDERERWGQSKDEIRTALWHWQFLRRHKLYQAHWKSDSYEYFRAFGIVGTPRPDPEDDFPMDLLFDYERPPLLYPTFIDVQKSWAENEARLKQQYNILRASKSSFDVMAASLYAPREKFMGSRERELVHEKYPNLLRALDALAAGEKLPRIAEYLGYSYNTVSRWRKSALELQSALTGLPRASF